MLGEFVCISTSSRDKEEEESPEHILLLSTDHLHTCHYYCSKGRSSSTTPGSQGKQLLLLDREELKSSMGRFGKMDRVYEWLENSWRAGRDSEELSP